MLVFTNHNTNHRILGCFVLLLVLSTSVFTQKSPLMITGSVSSVTPAGPRKEPYSWNKGIPQRTETYFNVTIRMQYFNRGDEPLIVPTPDRFIGTKKILFLEIPSPDSSVSETSEEWNRPESKDLMPGFIAALQNRFGPMEYFKKIEPKESIEFMVTFRAKSGFSIEHRETKDPRKPYLEVTIPKYPYFKIQYSLSMKDPLPVAEAKTRWSKFGKLVTSSDGDFFFETDVIINKLPD